MAAQMWRPDRQQQMTIIAASGVSLASQPNRAYAMAVGDVAASNRNTAAGAQPKCARRQAKPTATKPSPANTAGARSSHGAGPAATCAMPSGTRKNGLAILPVGVAPPQARSRSAASAQTPYQASSPLRPGMLSSQTTRAASAAARMQTDSTMRATPAR